MYYIKGFPASLNTVSKENRCSKGNGIVEEDNETERTATRAIAAAIINQKQHNDVYLNNAAQIAAGIANRDLYAIAGRIPEVRP